MKDLIHRILFPSKVKYIQTLKEANNKWARESQKSDENLLRIFNNNKHHFELLLIKDFVGYIPKDISEPALKVFEEYGEAFERWILWQSYYINKKAVNDPLKITLYNGMMIYLKVLQVMCMVNKRTYVPKEIKSDGEVDAPWIDKALSGLKEFKQQYYESNKSDKDTKTQELQDTKNSRTKNRTSKA